VVPFGGVTPSLRVILSFAALFLLAIPVWGLFGWSAVFGYLFGVLVATAYFIYLFLGFEERDPR
jgi:hypothetical protein